MRACFSENVAAALLFVNGGLGVMLGTQANLDHEAFHPDIVGRAIVDPPIKRSLFLCERRDTPSSRSMIYVRDLIVDLVRKEVTSGAWVCRRTP